MLKTMLKVVSRLIILTLVVTFVTSVIKFGIEFDMQTKQLKEFRDRFKIYLDLDDSQKVVLAKVGNFYMKYENVEVIDSTCPVRTGQRLKTTTALISNDILLLMCNKDNRIVRSVKIDKMALSHITPETEVIVY